MLFSIDYFDWFYCLQLQKMKKHAELSIWKLMIDRAWPFAFLLWSSFHFYFASAKWCAPSNAWSSWHYSWSDPFQLTRSILSTVILFHHPISVMKRLQINCHLGCYAFVVNEYSTNIDHLLWWLLSNLGLTLFVSGFCRGVCANDAKSTYFFHFGRYRLQNCLSFLKRLSRKSHFGADIHVCFLKWQIYFVCSSSLLSC